MEKKKIKVLMVIVSLKASDGVTNYAMNYFRKINHDVVHMDFVIYYSEDIVFDFQKEIESNGGKIFILPPITNIVGHYKKIVEILQNGKYDIIHNNSLLITIPMMFAAKQYGIPTRILHSHNSKLGETSFKEVRNRLFLPLLKRFANRYAACSEEAGKAMFKTEKYKIVPNVIDVHKYRFDLKKRCEVREKFGVEGKFVVATVGRIAEQKNPFFAMDVFKEVLERDSKAEYWWIGSGPLTEQIREYVKDIGLSENVRLFGSIENVADMYMAVDCFFLPSKFEGLGIVCIEAQAMGLPCVVSDVVPSLVEYTDLVQRLSLKEKKCEWGMKILEKKNITLNRTIYGEKLLDSFFSDIKAGIFLEEWYRSVME